jgi:hypothetical protein
MQNVLHRVPDVLDQIPPDAWPLIDRLFQITIAVAAVWLALSLFVYWRRRAANLTPVTAARKSKDAQPDFLNVDHEARRAAIERGEAFERQLEIREAEEARAAAAAALGPATSGRRLAKLAALVMSIFTLVTMIAGSIGNIGRMGEYMQQLSAPERLLAVVRNHPIGTGVMVLVIAAFLFQYFYERKWRPEHKES